MTFFWACVKDNKAPTLRFVSPTTNVVTDDTLTFLVEAMDEDGSIDKVDFYLNDSLVASVTQNPFKFDWLITAENKIGKYIVKAVAIDNDEGKTSIEMMMLPNTLHWLGDYEGLAHYYHFDPLNLAVEYYKKIQVNVNENSSDGTIRLVLTHEDGSVVVNDNLDFSIAGQYFNQHGYGSAYGNLNIKFVQDSLNYRYFQKCGIPCDSSLDFVIGKKK